MMKNIYLLISFALFSLSLNAQEMNRTLPRMDLNFAMGFPVGDYAESSHDLGFGVDLGIYFPINKDAPWFQIGPHFILMSTGTNNQDIDQQIEITLGNRVIDVIDLPMRVETINSIIGGHLAFRAEIGSPDNSFIPYVQGLIGGRRIATDITVYDESDRGFFDDDDGKITSNTALEDWLLSYGGGAGFHIRIGSRTYFNIGANLMIGGEAEYFTGEDIDNFQFDFIGDGDNYDPSDPDLNADDLEVNTVPTVSNTTMVQLNIGFNFMLNRR